jgi:predicted dehydrogenase
MALREFISPETLLWPFNLVKNTALQGWNEVAKLLGLHEDLYFNPLHKKLARPVKVILIGAGHRGSIYADYAVKNPREMNIVAVADPIPYRTQKMARIHKIIPAYCFTTWEEVFTREKFADAVIISTPDQLHTAPCLKAFEMGYDVLLEKPIGPTEEECRLILAKAKETGRIAGVCHVLRYTPYFRELKELLDAKMIGEVVSVQHLEPIEYIHMSHSYVRGNWRNSKVATPIILAKSCHDADMIRWLVNDSSDSVHCFGNLKWFKKENAPAGSTERCTDGCAVESTCPYSALQIYYRDRKRLYVFDLPEDKGKWDKAIMKGLKTSNYGRCVYRMDNDQPDHLTVNILFKNGATAAFSMEAFVSYEGRRTRIMGSMGDIYGDMENFTLTSFRTGKKLTWRMKTDSHGGGDHPLVKDWVQAVGQQNAALLSSSIDVSVESHIMAFAAERSRQNKTIENIIV